MYFNDFFVFVENRKHRRLIQLRKQVEKSNLIQIDHHRHLHHHHHHNYQHQQNSQQQQYSMSTLLLNKC
jgi:hypothetical protein